MYFTPFSVVSSVANLSCLRKPFSLRFGSMKVFLNALFAFIGIDVTYPHFLFFARMFGMSLRSSSFSSASGSVVKSSSGVLTTMLMALLCQDLEYIFD